ncbi:MAG: FeoA domain-containing protein [Thermotogota bacterium]|nr:FeoA domain-containing protein [Thermotogota bacterium]
MSEEPDILEIVKEDILKVVGREDEKIPLKSIELETAVSSSIVSEAIKELKEEGLIEISSEKETREEYIQLTKEGRVKANVIIKKYDILEEYFKERRSEEEAIKAADILEHYISTEVINTIKKLNTFKDKGIPLTEFKKEEGLITDINLNIGLFERIVSMGICPGEKIRIIGQIPNGIIIEVKNKKFALDKEIARKMKVLELEYEKA